MWPLDRFRKRKYDRRYRAALVVYLGTYLPERLDAETRRRVEIAVTRIIEGWSESGAAFRRWAPWKAWGSARAVAMANVGVEPPIAGLTWSNLLRGWSKWDPLFGAWDSRIAFVLNDFYPLDPASIDAREFLRREGFDIADRDPVERGASDSIGVWGDRIEGGSL